MSVDMAMLIIKVIIGMTVVSTFIQTPGRICGDDISEGLF